MIENIQGTRVVNFAIISVRSCSKGLKDKDIRKRVGNEKFSDYTGTKWI